MSLHRRVWVGLDGHPKGRREEDTSSTVSCVPVPTVPCPFPEGQWRTGGDRSESPFFVCRRLPPPDLSRGVVDVVPVPPPTSCPPTSCLHGRGTPTYLLPAYLLPVYLLPARSRSGVSRPRLRRDSGQHENKTKGTYCDSRCPVKGV